MTKDPKFGYYLVPLVASSSRVFFLEIWDHQGPNGYRGPKDPLYVDAVKWCARARVKIHGATLIKGRIATCVEITFASLPLSEKYLSWS